MPHLIIVDTRGVKFINEHLEVWINLAADPENDGRNWYAGAATSVLLHGKEMLDPFTAELFWRYMCHHQEKRCMQIDQVQLWDAGGTKKLGAPVDLAKTPYRLVRHSRDVDPSCINATLAAPFEVTYALKGQIHGITCELHRAISLATDADYLNEELSLEVLSGTERTVTEASKPRFAVRYYTYINTDLPTEPTVPKDVFVARSEWWPNPLYGFASDVPIEALEPKGQSFSFQLSAARSATCVHFFARHGIAATSRLTAATALKALSSFPNLPRPIAA